MSHKPVATLSGVSILSGMYAFARFGSLPSLFGSFGIGGLMAMSSMRMRDNLDYGVEGAAASSAMMAIPTAIRAVKTRAPIPAVVALLAVGSTGYYANLLMDRPKHRL